MKCYCCLPRSQKSGALLFSKRCYHSQFRKRNTFFKHVGCVLRILYFIKKEKKGTRHRIGRIINLLKAQNKFNGQCIKNTRAKKFKRQSLSRLSEFRRIAKDL
jgi:hypothetical protein